MIGFMLGSKKLVKFAAISIDFNISNSYFLNKS